MIVQISDPGPTLNQDQLTAFEADIGHDLPPAYRAFLMETNGGAPTPDHYPIEGLPGNPFGEIQQLFVVDAAGPHDVRTILRDVRDRLPWGFLPVGNSSTNDLLCISLREADYGAVYFWDTWDDTLETPYARSGYNNLYFVAEDFSSFLRSLRPYEDFEANM